MVKWGLPTWTFMHTLSIRLTEEQYTLWKPEVFNIILQLCRSLPCPDCAKHATEHVTKSKVPLTLMDFQQWLYQFHNEVNIRTNKRPYLPNILVVYEKIDLTKIFNICKYVILNQPYNPRLSMNKIQTRMNLQFIHTWLLTKKLID